MAALDTLSIRPLEPADARAAFDLVAHPEVARSLGGTPLDSPDGFEKRFLASFEPPGADRLGAFDGGALVGLVELARGARVRVAHAARMALAVRPDVQRRGIGAALLRAALDAADRWLNLVRVEVEVLAVDTAAQRLFEEQGFTREVHRRAAMVVDGALADTLALGRIRPGFVQAASALRPMPQLPPRAPRRVDVAFRPATIDDAPSVARFSQDTFVLFASTQLPTMSAESWRRRLAGWADGGATTAVAVVDGEIVACGHAQSMESQRQRHAAWIGLSVLTAYQGMGIGDRLTRILIESAEQWLGAERIELMVLADNVRAVSLYEKYGFVREGVVRFDVWRDGGYADSLVMSRLRGRAQQAADR